MSSLIINRIFNKYEINFKDISFLLLINKAWSILFKISLLVFAFPVVLLLRLLKPLVVIRLGKIDAGRIGGAYNAKWNLYLKQAGIYDKRVFDIYYFTYSIPHYNSYWKKIWEKTLYVFPFGRLGNAVDRINKLLPGHEMHKTCEQSWPPSLSVVKSIVSSDNRLLYTFNAEDEITGSKGLQSLGIPEGQPFICFHARDKSFLNSLNTNRDWSYHDFRDSNINDYIPAVEELTGRGYYAVRMGAVVEDKLNTNDPKIIDYVLSGKRTDFLDIYLGAKCSFFICSLSGIIIIPELFRRPVVYVNWTKLACIHSWVSNSLFIFKLFYSERENRLLKFQEIINLGIIGKGEELTRNKIRLIDNSSQEINEVVDEMDKRLKGAWKEDLEDVELQCKFWQLFGSDYIKSPTARIGSAFLKKYKYLLD